MYKPEDRKPPFANGVIPMKFVVFCLLDVLLETPELRPASLIETQASHLSMGPTKNTPSQASRKLCTAFPLNSNKRGSECHWQRCWQICMSASAKRYLSSSLFLRRKHTYRYPFSQYLENPGILNYLSFALLSRLLNKSDFIPVDFLASLPTFITFIRVHPYDHLQTSYTIGCIISKMPNDPYADYKYYNHKRPSDDERRCCVACMVRHEDNGCTCQCHRRPFNKPSEKKSDDGDSPMLIELLTYKMNGLKKVKGNIVKDTINSRGSSSYFVPSFDQSQGFALKSQRLAPRSRTPDFEMAQRRPYSYDYPKHVYSDNRNQDRDDCYNNNNCEEYYRPKTPGPPPEQDYRNNNNNEYNRHHGNPYGYSDNNGAYEW
ncbi:hypothetical protein BJ508DRAFT_347177 [Ascobolus immersus RN42]|uniref:Uncharacterized protein n=1 Tax=Ascobolus immersus RN42 TaxID=1160509 RepID=A0A3N4I4V9_ASCIM|nr:hypothetical protein BJ508DRAFT_347177 [Ascobolus immersus RN42]